MSGGRIRAVFPAALLLAATAVAPGAAQERETVAPPAGSALSELVSGYYYRTRDTRLIQDDEALNPGYLWIDQGAELWSEVDGITGRACADCHGDAMVTMRAVGNAYPKVHEATGKLINLEQRINLCRVENMVAPAWEWDSDELLAMTGYVRFQSRDLPVEVEIDGPARPYFEAGKALFYRRLGLLDMACAQCHERYAGKHLRANRLSQGHSNGFPIYHLSLHEPSSLHRWFGICNERVRATPYDPGAEEYVNLELYLAWRGSGLPVEVPAVR